MLKNKILIGLLLIGFLFSFSFAEAASCCFCNPDQLQKQMIYQSKIASTVYCSKPAEKGHILIIPNRHVDRIENLSPSEMMAIYEHIHLFSKAFKEIYGAEDYFLLQKNGVKAGQTVPHLHFHMIPCHTNIVAVMEKALNYRDTLEDNELRDCIEEYGDFLAKVFED